MIPQRCFVFQAFLFCIVVFPIPIVLFHLFCMMAMLQIACAEERLPTGSQWTLRRNKLVCRRNAYLGVEILCFGAEIYILASQQSISTAKYVISTPKYVISPTPSCISVPKDNILTPKSYISLTKYDSSHSNTLFWCEKI